MRSRSKLWRVLALLFSFALLAAACGDDDDDTASSGDDASEDTSGDEAAMPGEGVSVDMARANWNTGYMQAEIYQQLLEELGYDVSEPADGELGPETFYPALAQGEFDFWANGWFPIHEPQLEGDLPGGGTVADEVTRVGAQVEAGALQGYLIDKATADEHDITHVDQINDDPELTELFDTDGNGKADLTGCDEGWGCAGTINEQIPASDWDNIEHVQGSYSTLFTDTLARFQQGEPVFFYTWTPNYTVAQLVPGEDVVWLGVEEPVQEGAAESLSDEECPADPCEMGFVAADIQVVANNDFLAENPAAETLFELVEINPQAIYDQNLAMNDGEDSAEDIEAAAESWIEENRDTVDGWLEEARAAA
ncbi:MAG: glycine betaine/L-proline ABC transporter substrate-binding protein ProX [Acidimicrobiales bacterium]|nr:glycine betaine/L-proline ABC transporter substrate-binding protein ProX [Acidimicrobiales bacterium]